MRFAPETSAHGTWDGYNWPYIGVDQHDRSQVIGTGPGLSAVIKAVYKEIRDYFGGPATRQQETVQEALERLANEWRAETAFMSSVTDMAMHPAYQRIIGMGQPVVPYLLRELAMKPDHWFWALKAITDVDPVPACDRGNIQRMADAWVRWGKQQGFSEL